MSHKREIEEAEGRARITIAGIVSIIGRVPQAAIPDIQSILDHALMEARASVAQAESRRLERGPLKSIFTLLLLVPLLLGMGSCPREGDRQTLDQTIKAGAFVKTHPEAPPIVQKAGSDVELNGLTLQRNLVGEPEEPTKPYSSQASEEARIRADKEAQEPPAILKWAANLVTPFVPWAAPVLLGGWGLIEKLRRGKALQRLAAVYQGVETVKAQIGGGQYADAISGAMRTVAGNLNVYADIKREIGALRESGVVSKVDPTPPPPAVGTVVHHG